MTFLEGCRQRALDLIERYRDPIDEENFRSYIHAYTARQPSDAGRVQKSRGMEQAERVADYMLEYHRQREIKVQALQREVERLDMVISGEVEFMNSMKALAWAREAGGDLLFLRLFFP